MTQDPAGLLERIPELESLCGDARIRSAVESGDPFKVYRALFWAKWLGRLPAQRATLVALLGNRRLFAKPMKGSPTLFTLNSFGVGFVGGSEHANDGTYIATHAVVALFQVPLLPLGAYIVRNAGGSSYSIFARAPLGTLSWLQSRVTALLAIGSIVLGGAGAVHRSRYQQVRVFNAFAKPLQISIGKLAGTVPAHADAVFDVPVGVQPARAVAGDVVVDETSLEVSAGADLLAWNVAGATPVYGYSIRYSAHADDKTPQPEPTIYCGERVIRREKVDYAFREPDKTVSMSKGVGSVTRTAVGSEVARPDAALRCGRWLSGHDRDADALKELEIAARLSGWERELSTAAVGLASAISAEEGLRVARTARDAHPDSVDAHRAYQDAARRLGKDAELQAEYAARAKAQPESADAQYLSARLLDTAESREMFEKLAERFPAHPHILRALLWERASRPDWPGAREAWERLRTASPELAQESVEEGLRVLVMQGKRDEARALAAGFFDKARAPQKRHLATTYARLCLADKVEKPDALIAKLEEDGEKDWLLRVRAGLPVPRDAAGPGVALARATATSPALALQLAASASPLEVSSLGSDQWGLLYFEALRTQHKGALEKLGTRSGLPPKLASTLQAFVRGEPVRIDEDLDPTIRAAARFVRSRNAALPAAEREAQREEARTLQEPGSAITDALLAWKS